MTTILLMLVSLMGHPNYQIREVATDWVSWFNIWVDCRVPIREAKKTTTDEEIRERLNGVLEAYYRLNFKRLPTLTSMTGMNPGDPVWGQYFTEMFGGNDYEYALWQGAYTIEGNPQVLEGYWERTDAARKLEPELVRKLLVEYMTRWNMPRAKVIRIIRETLATEDLEPLAGIVGGGGLIR